MGCAATGDGPGADGGAAAVSLVIPPDGAGATEALVRSPRHGEWVDVPVDVPGHVPGDVSGHVPGHVPGDIPGSGGDGARSIRAWVVHPERSDRAPVVIVVHEIMGLTDWVRAVADRLAAEGYLAVAPDLLSGKGPGGGGSESFAGDAVRAAIRALDRAEVNARLDAVRAWAVARPSAAPRVACTGFCWGGSTTFAWAAHQRDLDAAIVWYGTAPADAEALARIEAPVLGLYGADDARVTSTVRETADAMLASGRAFTARVYDGAGHGFLRQQEGREGANRDASIAAWGEALAMLRRTLR